MHRHLLVHFLLPSVFLLLQQFLVRMHPVRHPELLQQIGHLLKIFLRRVAAELAEFPDLARQLRELVTQFPVLFQILFVNGDPNGHCLFSVLGLPFKNKSLAKFGSQGIAFEVTSGFEPLYEVLQTSA